MTDFSSTRSRAIGVVALLALAASLGSAAAQFNTTNASTPPIPPELDHARGADDLVPRELQARQLRRLREEHQKQVFSDAARLVQLATALRQQVQKDDKVTLDALKDVDEIGKLAKRLSDRIKTQ